MRNVDYARLRGFNIENILQYELTPTSFFLTKYGFLRKSQKSQLATEIKKLFDGDFPQVLPPTSDPRMIIIVSPDTDVFCVPFTIIRNCCALTSNTFGWSQEVKMQLPSFQCTS